MISICPPYGDPPKTIVLHHISQLSSLLPENADVITVFQIDFIGIWGETCDDAFSPQNDCAPSVVPSRNWR